eukprot:6611165-Prorocentrum_lima.AAC.1
MCIRDRSREESIRGGGGVEGCVEGVLGVVGEVGGGEAVGGVCGAEDRELVSVGGSPSGVGGPTSEELGLGWVEGEAVVGQDVRNGRHGGVEVDSGGSNVKVVE